MPLKDKIIKRGLTMSNSIRFEYLIMGNILIFLGILFLVNNFYPELEIWSKLIKLWPLVLVLYGIKKVYLALMETGKPNES